MIGLNGQPPGRGNGWPFGNFARKTAKGPAVILYSYSQLARIADTCSCSYAFMHWGKKLNIIRSMNKIYMFALNKGDDDRYFLTLKMHGVV